MFKIELQFGAKLMIPQRELNSVPQTSAFTIERQICDMGGKRVVREKIKRKLSG